jgi:hypothetical protein
MNNLESYVNYEKMNNQLVTEIQVTEMNYEYLYE